MFALFLCGVRTRKSMTNDELRTPSFVIPNVVRNPVGKRMRFFAYALNDNLMVNYQWLIVMRGTRYPNATLCHSERSEESRLERLRRSSLRPRAVSRRSSEQDERKSGCPKRSELPDFPACERREGVRSARSLDLWVTFGSSQK